MIQNVLKKEWLLLPGFFLLALLYSGDILLNTEQAAWLYWSSALVLFVVVLLAVFAVVRHSDALAIKLGEPYGTLILTLAVILLEVALIISVKLSGNPSPTMARDTMFAVVMLVLNGLMGVTLIVGGLKFHTLRYILDGARSYLAGIVPLSLICLVLPNYTAGGVYGGLSVGMSVLLVTLSLLIYGVFLLVQTRSHSHFFVDPAGLDLEEGHHADGSTLYHALLLVAYLALVILLAKALAYPIESGVALIGAPAALTGLIVAMVVLAPEAVGGIKAAMGNQLQRSMNLFLGSVLATIALTAPAVLVLALMLDQSLILGLSQTDMVLLAMTLLLCKVSFSGSRTNVLHGVSHLALFLVYLVLMFDQV